MSRRDGNPIPHRTSVIAQMTFGPKILEIKPSDVGIDDAEWIAQTTASLAGTGSPRAMRAMFSNMRRTVGSKVSQAIVRGLVRRVTVTPGEDDEPQTLEIDAGSPPVATPTDQYCNIGCGGWI